MVDYHCLSSSGHQGQVKIWALEPLWLWRAVCARAGPCEWLSLQWLPPNPKPTCAVSTPEVDFCSVIPPQQLRGTSSWGFWVCMKATGTGLWVSILSFAVAVCPCKGLSSLSAECSRNKRLSTWSLCLQLLPFAWSHAISVHVSPMESAVAWESSFAMAPHTFQIPVWSFPDNSDYR